MKQKGDKASYAQSNTTGKVMGELYKQATGIKAVEVPYRTANDSSTTSRAAGSTTA